MNESTLFVSDHIDPYQLEENGMKTPVFF